MLEYMIPRPNCSKPAWLTSVCYDRNVNVSIPLNQWLVLNHASSNRRQLHKRKQLLLIENYGLFKFGMFTHVPFKAKIAKNTVSFWTERGEDWNFSYFPITASNSVPSSIVNEYLAKTPHWITRLQTSISGHYPWHAVQLNYNKLMLPFTHTEKLCILFDDNCKWRHQFPTRESYKWQRPLITLNTSTQWRNWISCPH